MSEDPVAEIARIIREQLALVEGHPGDDYSFSDNCARALIDAGRAVPETMTADRLDEIANRIDQTISGNAAQREPLYAMVGQIRSWADDLAKRQ